MGEPGGDAGGGGGRAFVSEARPAIWGGVVAKTNGQEAGIGIDVAAARATTDPSHQRHPTPLIDRDS